MTDASGHPMTRTVRRDTAEPAYAITGTVADKAAIARMPPERLYGIHSGG